jgi:hypothetical protein
MGGPVGEGPSSASHGRRVARPRLSPPCQRGGTSATRTMSPAAPPASPSQCDMFPSQGREMGKGVIGGCSPNGARVLTARSRHPAAGRGHPGGKVTKLPNLARRGPILSSRPHSTSLARYPPIRLAAYPPSAALGRRHRRTASPAPAGADRGRGGRRGRGAADHLVARRGWQGGHRGVHPTARALTSNGRSQR